MLGIIISHDIRHEDSIVGVESQLSYTTMILFIPLVCFQCRSPSFKAPRIRSCRRNRPR
jgi:hypothetical protein